MNDEQQQSTNVTEQPAHQQVQPQVSQGLAPHAVKNITKIRSVLIKMMLGAVIAAAAVAVIAILVGSFGDVAWRSIGTIASAIIHILVLLTIVTMSVSNSSLTSRSTDIVINSTMAITVLSFFTSVFNVWGLLEGELSAKLYLTYAVALFVLIHAKALIDAEAVYHKVRPYILANYVFIASVAGLILGVVYVDNGFDLLSGFYGRLLAASAIIDVTLGIIVAVMYKLHIQNNPELQKSVSAGSGAPIRGIVVTLLVFFFLVLPLLNVVISAARL